jgi:hypothetical protein
MCILDHTMLSHPEGIVSEKVYGSRAGLQIEGVLAYFTHVRYVFTKTKKLFNFFVKMTLVRFIHLIMQEYDSKCLKLP